jgi:CelD/BcsL family acetyltransferase involved in cellulose biosynthesis
MSSTALFRTEAEIASERTERSGPIAVDTSLGMIELRIGGDLQNFATVWEELQAVSPCTGAQTFDWAQAWDRHVLGPKGDVPVIAIGAGANGQALFLWPFEMGRLAGLRVLKWLGQDHANYNLGLFAPGVAAALTQGDMSRLLWAVARGTGAGAVHLKAQPFAFDGIPNPFAKLPHQLAPSSGYAVRLGDFNALYERRFGKRSRHTFDRKERKLIDRGRLTYGWAATRAEKLHLVETFFAQKARQFAAMGITDIFDVHARAFYRELALLEGDNPGRLRLGYIKLDDKVLATFSGTLGHGRLLIVLCSLAEGDLQRHSPGALLIRHQIEEACGQGLALYDFGAGSGTHKEQWCDLAEPLFDSFIAFKPHGLAVTLPLAALSRIKRAIKTNAYFWFIARTLRTGLFGKAKTSLRPRRGA